MSSPDDSTTAAVDSTRLVASPNTGADRLIRTISEGGTIAIKTLVASGLVGEALRRRRYAPTAGDALGRAIMGALLIAVGSAPDDADEANVETVQLQFRGKLKTGAHFNLDIRLSRDRLGNLAHATVFFNTPLKRCHIHQFKPGGPIGIDCRLTLAIETGLGRWRRIHFQFQLWLVLKYAGHAI